MNPLVGILQYYDFAGIGLIVFVFVTAARIDLQRLAIRRLERKLDALLQHHGIELRSKLSPGVLELLRDPNKKIAAVKLHREQTGASLAEAKKDVDEYGA